MNIEFLSTNEGQYQVGPKGTLPAFIPADYMLKRLSYHRLPRMAEASRVEDLELLRENWVTGLVEFRLLSNSAH